MCHHVCLVLMIFVSILSAIVRLKVLRAVNIRILNSNSNLVLLHAHFAQMDGASFWSILSSTWLYSSALRH